jgi:hypothetical protein
LIFPAPVESSTRNAALLCIYGKGCETDAQPESANAIAVNAAVRWLENIFIC